MTALSTKKAKYGYISIFVASFRQEPMMRFFWWFLAGAVISLSSCVSNKRYVLLQHDDVKARDLPTDTVVRKYTSALYDYRIQPHDALYTQFRSLTDKKFDFLNADDQASAASGQNLGIRSELVDINGDITYPVIGKVRVGGLTVFEAQEKLQGLANQYLESAVVKVRMVNFRFTFMGEVKQEGTITSFNNRISVPEAIGLAGGLDDLADKSKIKLVRIENGQTTITYLNLLDEDFVNSPYYFVHQNDVFVVPPLRQRPFRKYFGQNLSIVLSSVSVLLLVISLSK